MVANPRKRFVTPHEYLEIECNSETKHEYEHGEILAMTGASPSHNFITFNTITTIGTQLEGKSCVGMAQDMRVRAKACNAYFYPDIVVACSKPQFEHDVLDTLVNPTLIIEVLSESTEQRDRKLKFDCYWTIESLTDYVLISQTEPRIEHWSRLSDGRGWRYVVAHGLDAVLNLPSIGCELELARVYAHVEFAPSAPAPPPGEVADETTDTGQNQ